LSVRIDRAVSTDRIPASVVNDLLLVTGALALVGGLASMALIRSRDFAHARAAAAQVSRPAEASA
jgi:hypothetical protein